MNRNFKFEIQRHAAQKSCELDRFLITEAIWTKTYTAIYSPVKNW